ncbi:MAG TPA: hypothetical protein VF529_13100 [Solirubrobacteraceae bacterium]|jgi:MoaA/NifB/PqqE/SkfB family radical SAM enzyme
MGLATSVNTQIGPETIAQLPALLDCLVEVGATHWQIQLTVAMGNAVDNPDLILQPHQLLELHERGRRERVVKVEDAGRDSFSVGPDDPENGAGRVPPALRMCHGCSRFVLPDETDCPFCAGDLDELDREHERVRAYRRELIRQVEEEIRRATA